MWYGKITPIRIAIAVAAFLAFGSIPAASSAECSIQADYAKVVMTDLLADMDNMWANVEPIYLFYASSGPSVKHGIWNRAIEKIQKLNELPNFDPWDPVDAELAINSFQWTTFLACKVGE